MFPKPVNLTAAASSICEREIIYDFVSWLVIFQLGKVPLALLGMSF